MAKNLVIVESPAKAKTIEGFLGADYTVKSCYGHIRDLVKDNNGVLIDKGFLPVYEVPDEKKQVVAELKKLAEKAEVVWLASDEDREGEAISWHLSEVLKLKENKTRRIVFHEITKPAILKAISNPRSIDVNLVNAQQARRVLDRIVGFELSPVLWKKVKPSLSAGRVQSVSVRLIVEREREINEFNSTGYFKVVAEFYTQKDKKLIKADLGKKFDSLQDADKFLTDCADAIFKVRDIEVKPAKRTPAAPFTTSTLQQEASRKLGFSVSQTMSVAQKLYEAGLITYMRTDSVNLSELAIAAAKEEINKAYGANFAQERRYQTKSSSAQEAHEAIRPTYFNRHSIDGDSAERRLYDLIWKRAIASQMADARLERTLIHIENNKRAELFTAEGEIIKFEGFLKVYLESTDDDSDEENVAGLLPAVNAGEILVNDKITATQKFTRPPARYTEASLVKKLEELGIGRPSTYAPTISTIQKRGYVVKEDREGKERPYQILTLQSSRVKREEKTEITGAEKSKLFPTDIGTLVTDFLLQHFKDIMDYGFTAAVEKEFDEIAEGLINWTKMLESFYKPFHKSVDKTIVDAERVTGERVLGKDPETGKQVIARMGRFGPIVQIGDSNEDDKPKYASLRPGQMIESISLDDAMELFKLPRTVGEFEGKPMKVAIGRFGPYIAHDSKFYSLAKTDDPYSIDQDRAVEIIENKRVADANKLIKVFKENEEVQILNGRWGPYITDGKVNAKIPKGKKPESLEYAEVLELLKEGKASGKSSAKAKKTTESATPKKVAASIKAKATPKAKSSTKTSSKKK